MSERTDHLVTLLVRVRLSSPAAEAVAEPARAWPDDPDFAAAVGRFVMRGGTLIARRTQRLPFRPARGDLFDAYGQFDLVVDQTWFDLARTRTVCVCLDWAPADRVGVDFEAATPDEARETIHQLSAAGFAIEQHDTDEVYERPAFAGPE